MNTKKPEMPFSGLNCYAFDRLYEAALGVGRYLEERNNAADAASAFKSGLRWARLSDANITLPDASALMRECVTVAEAQNKSESLIEAARAECERAAKENAQAEAQNEEVIAIVKRTLLGLGIAETYTTFGYKSSRSRTKTSQQHASGFLYDLTRCKPKSNVAAMRDLIQTRQREYSAMIDRYMDKEREESKKRKQHLLEENATFMLTMIESVPTLFEDMKELGISLNERLLSSGPDDVSRKQVIDRATTEVIENLCKADKYFALAYHLELNRGDWTSGYSHAKTGLEYFMIESELDEQIYYFVYSVISSSDVDGRHFRDGEWNYNRIYALASPDVMGKFQKIAHIRSVAKLN